MKKSTIFWVGYSDLMTSMFFIMLVLFVLSIGYLQIKNKELEENTGTLIKEKEKLEKLLNLEKQFKPLIQDSSFYYLPNCQKFIVKDLMGIEIFEPNELQIKPEYIGTTIATGKKIEGFLNNLLEQNKELFYLLVIEGNMANDWEQSIAKDNVNGYKNSYERALAVYNLWINSGINLRKKNVEVLICGSGFNGLCRDPIQENNKRFSIQIIPKVSK